MKMNTLVNLNGLPVVWWYDGRLLTRPQIRKKKSIRHSPVLFDIFILSSQYYCIGLKTFYKLSNKRNTNSACCLQSDVIKPQTTVFVVVCPDDEIFVKHSHIRPSCYFAVASSQLKIVCI